MITGCSCETGNRIGFRHALWCMFHNVHDVHGCGTVCWCGYDDRDHHVRAYHDDETCVECPVCGVADLGCLLGMHWRSAPKPDHEKIDRSLPFCDLKPEQTAGQGR